jgi:hypothetical protein
MVNWLRNKLHNFLFPQDRKEMSIVSARAKDALDIEGLRFTVMPAEGGTIVQMRVYDRRKDDSNIKTYVIPDTEQDVAHRVGQIVAMELMKV